MLKESRTAKRFAAALSLFLVIVGFATTQEAEQSLKRAKVADYVPFKLDNDQG